MASAKAADSAISHRGRWTSAKRQGGPDPPETKVGVTFLKRAATIERAWHSGCDHRDMPRRFPPPWSIEERQESLTVKDANGRQIADLYFEDEPQRQLSTKRGEHRQAAERAAGDVEGHSATAKFSQPRRLSAEIDVATDAGKYREPVAVPTDTKG